MTEVSFGDFAALARRRGWTVDFLTDHFRNRIEDPRDFFKRVMQGQYAAVVIPYNSVLAFYGSELGFHQEATGTERRCRCGCGVRVFDRKIFASSACRKRGQRIRQQLKRAA